MGTTGVSWCEGSYAGARDPIRPIGATRLL
jgi:hypothetical protein